MEAVSGEYPEIFCENFRMFTSRIPLKNAVIARTASEAKQDEAISQLEEFFRAVIEIQ